MPQMRGAQILWDAAAGVIQNGVSKTGEIGPMSTVAVFVQSDGAATFKIQASASKGLSSGRNDAPDAVWFDYLRDEALDEAETIAGHLTTINFAGAGAICVNLSPFAPTFLRLIRTDASAAVTVSAWTVAVG